jgi:hypothetical protein
VLCMIRRNISCALLNICHILPEYDLIYVSCLLGQDFQHDVSSGKKDVDIDNALTWLLDRQVAVLSV